MNERGTEVLEKIRARRGSTLPAFEFLAERDPDFLDGYEGMAAACMGKNAVLPRKLRELVLIAADMALGMPPNVIGAHARYAMEEGATQEEVTAVFELVMLAFGAKAMAVGVPALRDFAG
jgi:alkylhydroperoxidase/carboxymuconolactone decarboxylase family protein YurZ